MGTSSERREPCKHQKTAIVTGASQGIGACLVKTLLAREYQVVATARSMGKSGFHASKQLALVDGDIGEASTAKHIAATAIEHFGGIDTLVNNAGIFFTKPFPEYTTEDVRKLVSTNLYGFVYLTQLVITQMQQQKTGGSVLSITTSMVDHPIAGVAASVPMMTKGGIEAISKNLAMEYAKAGIRFNAVAPGRSIRRCIKTIPRSFCARFPPWGASRTRRKSRMRSCFWRKRHTLLGRCYTSMAARTWANGRR